MIETAPEDRASFEAPSGGAAGRGVAKRRQRHACRRVENRRLIDAATRYFRVVFGEDAGRARLYSTDEFLLVRTGNLLGPAERNLLETGDGADSDFIRSMKLRLAGSNLAGLASGLAEETGLRFEESFLSYSPRDDEMIIMLKFAAAEKG